MWSASPRSWRARSAARSSCARRWRSPTTGGSRRRARRPRRTRRGPWGRCRRSASVSLKYQRMRAAYFGSSGRRARAQVGEGDVALGVAQAALEPAEPLEHVRGVLPHERPRAAVVGRPEEREDVCRVAGSGGPLAAGAAAGQEGLHRLELVRRVLRGRRGLEGQLEQADDLGVVLLGAAHEGREPGAADGAEADVGAVLAGPLVHRLLEGDEVAAGHEVGEDLAQLAVAGRHARRRARRRGPGRPCPPRLHAR